MKNIIYINALIALMLFTGCSKNDDNQSSTISQKDALIAIYNANPANTLTWDITSNNLGTWENVTINKHSIRQWTRSSRSRYLDVISF